MTYKELLSQKEDILREKELLEKRLCDINNQIYQANKNRANCIFENIKNSIKELDEIGYKLVNVVDIIMDGPGPSYICDENNLSIDKYK